MKGILTFFINMQPDSKENPKVVIEILKEINKDLFEKITSECGYHIAFFPTFNESCRVEKIDFDKSTQDLLSNTFLQENTKDV
jgi:hypothetical protein